MENSKTTCQQIIRQIALSLLVIMQIVIFIVWILTVEIHSKNLINGLFDHLVFFLLTSFVIFLIVALAKSISSKDQNREDLDLYIEKEVFLRKVKEMEERISIYKEAEKKVKEAAEKEANGKVRSK